MPSDAISELTSAVKELTGAVKAQGILLDQLVKNDATRLTIEQARELRQIDIEKQQAIDHLAGRSWRRGVIDRVLAPILALVSSAVAAGIAWREGLFGGAK